MTNYIDVILDTTTLNVLYARFKFKEDIVEIHEHDFSTKNEFIDYIIGTYNLKTKEYRDLDEEEESEEETSFENIPYDDQVVMLIDELEASRDSQGLDNIPSFEEETSWEIEDIMSFFRTFTKKHREEL